MVSDLIVGVVVDVDRHVFVKHFNGLCVGFVSGATRDFIILHAPKFVVLDPKIGLEYFCRRCESEQRCAGSRALFRSLS